MFYSVTYQIAYLLLIQNPYTYEKISAKHASKRLIDAVVLKLRRLKELDK